MANHPGMEELDPEAHACFGTSKHFKVPIYMRGQNGSAEVEDAKEY